MELEGILQFFENKTILVTGATGFLAKGSLSPPPWLLSFMYGTTCMFCLFIILCVHVLKDVGVSDK